MSKSVDMPTDYTIHSVMSGSLDLDLDNIHLSVEKIPTISLTTQSKLDSTSKLDSNSTVDLGLDDIRIKELPKIDLRVEMAVKPMRVHFPVNYKFGLCSMGWS